MTTPINTFEEILEALERDPALKEALRRHILTDELLQMPVRLERIETDVSTLKENLTTLTNTVNRIGGDTRSPPPTQAPWCSKKRRIYLRIFATTGTSRTTTLKYSKPWPTTGLRLSGSEFGLETSGTAGTRSALDP